MPRLESTPALDRFREDVRMRNVSSLHTDQITLRGNEAWAMLLEIAALKRELQKMCDDNAENLERMRVTLAGAPDAKAPITPEFNPCQHRRTTRPDPFSDEVICIDCQASSLDPDAEAIGMAFGDPY